MTNYQRTLPMIAVFAVAVQSTAALLGMAWSPLGVVASIWDEEKGCVMWASLGFTCILNAIWVGFRVMSIAMLAAASTTCFIVVLVTHWIIMVFWVMNDRKES